MKFLLLFFILIVAFAFSFFYLNVDSQVDDDCVILWFSIVSFMVLLISSIFAMESLPNSAAERVLRHA